MWSQALKTSQARANNISRMSVSTRGSSSNSTAKSTVDDEGPKKSKQELDISGSQHAAAQHQNFAASSAVDKKQKAEFVKQRTRCVESKAAQSGDLDNSDCEFEEDCRLAEDANPVKLVSGGPARAGLARAAERSAHASVGIAGRSGGTWEIGGYVSSDDEDSDFGNGLDEFSGCSTDLKMQLSKYLGGTDASIDSNTESVDTGISVRAAANDEDFEDSNEDFASCLGDDIESCLDDDESVSSDHKLDSQSQFADTRNISTANNEMAADVRVSSKEIHSIESCDPTGMSTAQDASMSGQSDTSQPKRWAAPRLSQAAQWIRIFTELSAKDRCVYSHDARAHHL